MGNVRTLLTFEEFERMPEQPGKQELIRGELIELPPADFNHNQSAHLMYKFLDAALAGLKARGEALALGTAYHEMGYKMPNNSWFIPDVSITHADQARRKYLEGPPAVAIEIVSQGNTPKAINTKIQDYLAYGALQVWVIFPEHRHMWIYEPHGQANMFSGRFPLTLLPGIELDLDQILGQ
jgi:Uma2 family endonuclease